MTDGKEVSIDVTEIADINYDSLSVCEKMEAVALETASGCEVEALVEVKVSALENVETSSETEGAQTLTEQEAVQEETQTQTESTQEEVQLQNATENTCNNCGGTGTCKVCGGGQHHSENNHNENHH